MPLYRTVSDRGVWKKYRDPKPQHFHKPSYLDLDKDKPQVTYSQLQLGDNYRSYNHRQSHPNLREEPCEAADAEHCNQITDNWYTRRNRARSAPATPRATTPTRSIRATRMNDDFRYEDVVKAPATMTMSSSTSRHQPRPDSQFSSTYADDGFSLDSSSLAAFSNTTSSTLGRDSTLGFRYPYSSEPVRVSYVTTAQTDSSSVVDRPNPFSQGSEVSREADSVVQMFLMNQKGLSYSNPPDPDLQGRSPQPSAESSTLLSDSDADAGRDKNSHYYSQSVIAQLRQQFLSPNATPPQDPPQDKLQSTSRLNKFLRQEQSWTPTATIDDATVVQQDTVQTFQVPQMHHAEVVTLRQDSSSDSDSNEAEHHETPPVAPWNSPSPIQISNVQPVGLPLDSTPRVISVINQSNKFDDPAYANFQSMSMSTPVNTLPPMAKFHELAPPTMLPATNEETDGDHQMEAPFPPNQHSSKKKSGGGLFSFFKKSNSTRRSKKSAKGKKPRAFDPPDGDYCEHDDVTKNGVEQQPSSSTDGPTDSFYQVYFDGEPHKLRVQQPMGYLMKNESMITHPGMSLDQELGAEDTLPSQMNDQLAEPQPEPEYSTPQKIHRKLSMSKPTDLDAILQQQAEDEAEARRQHQQEQDVFTADPWFAKQSLNHSMDTTQEVDIDEILGYSDTDITAQPALLAAASPRVEDIAWPHSTPPVAALGSSPTPAMAAAWPPYNQNEQPASPTRQQNVVQQPGMTWPQQQLYSPSPAPVPMSLSPVEEIVWPKSSSLAIQQTHPNMIEIDYSPSSGQHRGKPKKKPFFNFPKKAKKPNSASSMSSEPDSPVQPPQTRSSQPHPDLDHSSPEDEDMERGRQIEDQPDRLEVGNEKDGSRATRNNVSPKKSSSLTGIFKRPSWKAPSKPRSSAKPQIGDLPPVDVSHLIEDDQVELDPVVSPPRNEINELESGHESDPVQATEDNFSTSAEETDETKEQKESRFRMPVEMQGPEPTKGGRRPRKKGSSSALSSLFSSATNIKKPHHHDDDYSAAEASSSSDFHRKSDFRPLSGLFGSKKFDKRRRSMPPAPSTHHSDPEDAATPATDEDEPEPPPQDYPTSHEEEEDHPQNFDQRRHRPADKGPRNGGGGLARLFDSGRSRSRNRATAKSTGHLPTPDSADEGQLGNPSSASLSGPRRHVEPGRSLSGILSSVTKGKKPSMPKSSTLSALPASGQAHDRVERSETEGRVHHQIEFTDNDQQLPPASAGHFDPQVPARHLADDSIGQHQYSHDSSKRQMGRRSGRFRRSDAGMDSLPANSSWNESSGATDSSPNMTTQSVMRNMFAQSVSTARPAAAAKAPDVQPTRGTSRPPVNNTDAMAASTLGSDLEYEEALRVRPSKGGGRPATRSESYRQASGAAAPADSRPSGHRQNKYNSLPRSRGTNGVRTARDVHFDSRSLGRGGRPANDPCSIM